MKKILLLFVVIFGMKSTAVFSQTSAQYSFTAKIDSPFVKKKAPSFFTRVFRVFKSSDSTAVPPRSFVMQRFDSQQLSLFSMKKFSEDMRQQLYWDSISFGSNYTGIRFP